MNTGATPQIRPQFRNHQSNYVGAGYASPMTAIVASSKVDYSMTKGGIRLWAVLFVFFLSCASLFTVFSVQGDNETNLNDDENVDCDGEIEIDTAEFVQSHPDLDQKPSEVDTSELLYDQDDSMPHELDDASTNDEFYEHEKALLAELRAKMSEKSQVRSSRKSARQRKSLDETKFEKLSKTVQRIDDEDDDVTPKIKEEKNEAAKNAEKTTEKQSDKISDPEDQEMKPRKLKHPKIECKRKNCESEYNATPRKSLLKQKPNSAILRSKDKMSANRNAGRRDEDVEDVEVGDDDNVTQKSDGDDSNDQDNNELDEKEEYDGNEFYDAIKASRAERLSDTGLYKRHAITSKDDNRYREDLDKADYLVEKHMYKEAFAIYETILDRNPDSPRAHFGIARACDIRSEIESNRAYLDQAISEYQEVLDIKDTPDALFRQAGYRLIDRARFRNMLHKALQAQRSLIDRYPEELQFQNEFGLTFLMMQRNDDALRVFQNVLKVDSNNAIAQAYYGYILKLNGDLENAVIHMRKGLRKTRNLIVDPKFYYHFGDALTKLGRTNDAFDVYNIGTKVGLFISPYQRSLYNYEGLAARPWWPIDQTTYGRHLKAVERQWVVVRDEAIRLITSNHELFIDDERNLAIGGKWSAYYIYRHGIWENENCQRIPKTCEVMSRFKENSNATKSEIKIELLASGSRVWPHCGPSNSRLRAELGLVAPSEARIRVGDEIKGWKTGKFIVYDDSFEHELWFVGTSQKKYRLILELDLWHPEIESSNRVNVE